MFRRGASLADLAEEFKITPQRVGQVVAAFHPEGDEDDDRALFRGCLWRLYDEVEGILQDPGYKMSPNGGPARGPDGEPALDTNTKIQAGDLQLKVITELRKLDARDRPVVRKFKLEMTEAERQKNEAVQVRRREMLEIAARAGQPAVVSGEIVRPEIEG